VSEIEFSCLWLEFIFPFADDACSRAQRSLHYISSNEVFKRIRISTPSLLEEGNRRVYKLTRQYLYLSKTVTRLEWVTGWFPDHGLYGGVCKTKLFLHRTWRGGCLFSSFWVDPRSELCWVLEIHDSQVEGDSEFVHDNRQEGRLEHMLCWFFWNIRADCSRYCAYSSKKRWQLLERKSL
jgi:hypothetical protein